MEKEYKELERENFIIELENHIKMAKENPDFYLSNHEIARILYENIDIIDLENIIEILQKNFLKGRQN